MPLPKPEPNEERNEFLQRCMIDKTSVEDFQDEKQRIAVCIQQWDQSTGEDSMAFADSYNDYPESASNNAKKVLRWRDEHGDEVKGMTAVGWTRANQLAKRENISRDTIARMASFKRHQKNAEINPDFKSAPWKDAGYVAWLGWGGTSGVEWAIRKLKQIDKTAANNMEKKFAFGIQGIDESKVDRDSGTMMGVSLISVGPAMGHGLFVDGKSIQTIADELEGQKLPAYITHRGALFEDRLTREVGMFSNFRIDGDRLLGDFQAFDSFREDDARKFNRLFEMAEKMPERFGLSIVFSATSAWATPDGDIPMGRFPNNDSDRLYDENNPPEEALFEFPSIRVEEVSSADFVDSPAANQRGLFSKIDKLTNIKMTKAELTEKNAELAAEAEELKAKLAEIESNLAEDEETMAEDEPSDSIEESSADPEDEDSTDEDEPEADISEENEMLKEENAALKAELEELKAKLAESEDEMSKLNEELESSQAKAEEDAGEMMAKQARIAQLSKLIEGSEPIKFSKVSEDYTPSKANRDKVIAEYAAMHSISEFTATIRLGKERPEIFKN